jgi:hypothetical protein
LPIVSFQPRRALSASLTWLGSIKDTLIGPIWCGFFGFSPYFIHHLFNQERERSFHSQKTGVTVAT